MEPNMEDDPSDEKRSGCIIERKIKMIIKLKGDRMTRRVWMNDKELLSNRSLRLRNHSPTGFAWGYGGSGPSQLALAILIELYEDDIALELYQEFKWNCIAALPRGDFEFQGDISYDLNPNLNKEGSKHIIIK